MLFCIGFFIYICGMEKATAATYLENLIRVRDSIPMEVSKIAYKKEIEIIDLNREDQLFEKGIGIDGRILGLYAKNYEGSGRGFPKKKYDRYNFLNTGNLFDSFDMITNGYELEIRNNDSKVNLLTDFVEGKFIGLTKENQEVLNWDMIYPDLMEFINSKL